MNFNYLKIKNQKKQLAKPCYEFSLSDLEEIETMARAGMAKTQIAKNFLEVVSQRTFLHLIEIPDHPVYKAFQKGFIVGEFTRQNKMNENAEKGNVTAAQQLDKKMQFNKVTDLKNKYWG